MAPFVSVAGAVGFDYLQEKFMGLLSKIGNAIHKVCDKVVDGVKAVAEAVKSTVQSLGNAIKSIAEVAACLAQGDLAGAFKCATKALTNLVNVAAFCVCPAMSMASAFVAGSVGGQAGQALGMLTGGPKAMLTKGAMGDMAKDMATDTALRQTNMPLPAQA
jgi:phage-related protein